MPVTLIVELDGQRVRGLESLLRDLQLHLLSRPFAAHHCDLSVTEALAGFVQLLLERIRITDFQVSDVVLGLFYDFSKHRLRGVDLSQART